MADQVCEDEEWMEIGEEEIRSMAVNRVNRDYGTLLTNIQTKITDAEVLREMESPWFAQLDSADLLEEKAASVAEIMAQAEVDCRLGADAFAGRPGEEALVEILRKDAAWSGAQRARAEEIAAGVRRLQEMCLRAMAADEAPLWMATMDFVDFVSGEMDGKNLPWPTEVEAAAAAAEPGSGTRFAKKLAKRAERLRRGAAALAGEVSVAEKLRERAAWVEASSADVTLVEKMMSSVYWKCWKIVCESAGQRSTAAASLPANRPNCKSGALPTDLFFAHSNKKQGPL